MMHWTATRDDDEFLILRGYPTEEEARHYGPIDDAVGNKSPDRAVEYLIEHGDFGRVNLIQSGRSVSITCKKKQPEETGDE